ncbi:rRNA maturation RNase YbeY [Phormidium sp. CLA17]|uniref:rRNA maturation RNase YbeY n=1 Tax=Leptolyngbya sp. Cla-17 TaxID=2803751 RepID=UPI00149154BB|nr:rRNA maturation RNase YbeY [Leptolyngbya sp. Cla-17]MBM0742953.1 rRNA maturation RNase YbeY [Leptolyngbya sp. Cla-17]
MGISVEVCVQDCIFEAQNHKMLVGSDCALDPLPSSCPITEAVWSEWFQQWLEIMQPSLSPLQAYELSLRLTGDREIQTLNAQYRHQDKSTDVLAFAALEVSSPQNDEVFESQPLYLGDIIISVETAQQQANSQNHSLSVELSWLATHGLLHLLGWDHPDEESLSQMLAKQQFLLNTVGLSSKNR